MTFEIEVGGRTRNVESRGSTVLLDGRPVDVDAARVGYAWSVIVGSAHAGHGETARRTGRSYEVALIEHAAGELTVHVNGRPIRVRSSHQGFGARRIRPGGRSETATNGPQRVVAPMPGRIAKVLVKVGDVVAARQALVVVEAMKMENELRVLRAGTVTQVPAVEGALVEANTVLVIVE